MSNELTILIAEKLGLACEYVEQNFADVYSRFIAYQNISHIISLIFDILFMCGAVIWFVSLYQGVQDKKGFFTDSFGDVSTASFIISVIMAIAGIIAILAIIYDLDKLISWNICPEMEMLESLK